MTVSGKLGQYSGWRLNEELIRDEEGSAIVGRELENYFALNGTGEVSGSTLWEAPKAYIRGILIELGGQKKKERTEKIRTPTNELYGAEQEHKKHPDRHQYLYQKVVNKRTELKVLLDHETRITFNRIARERYQWGNKPSRYLARMLQKKKAINYIEKIQTKEGKMFYLPKGIMDIFKNCYQELYSVEHREARPGENSRKIINFLRKAGLPKIEAERERHWRPQFLRRK